MTKTWVVQYKPRGGNYKFMSPYTMTTVAKTKAEAKENVFLRIGDMYRITSITEKDGKIH